MDRIRGGYVEGFVSLIVNAVLFGLKLWAGILSGSIALVADAWHTLSDSASSIIVITASKLSARKPDNKHPFGYGRWEQIGALFVAFLMMVIAYEFLKKSIIRIDQHESVQFGTLAIAVTAVSIAAKEALTQYAFYVWRKTGNLNVKADGWHHRSDALSSIAVLAGILLANRFWWIDGVLGIIIALLLFHATYGIIKGIISKLLGEKPSQELIDKITELVKNLYRENLQPHHFHIHNYVTYQELTFHIKIDSNQTIREGHQITIDIENLIYDKLGIVATIHVEPLDCIHAAD